MAPKHGAGLSCGGPFELRYGDGLDPVDWKLQESLSERAEFMGRAGGQEAARSLAARIVLDAPSRNRRTPMQILVVAH